MGKLLGHWFGVAISASLTPQLHSSSDELHRSRHVQNVAKSVERDPPMGQSGELGLQFLWLKHVDPRTSGDGFRKQLAEGRVANEMLAARASK